MPGFRILPEPVAGPARYVMAGGASSDERSTFLARLFALLEKGTSDKQKYPCHNDGPDEDVGSQPDSGHANLLFSGMGLTKIEITGAFGDQTKIKRDFVAE